MSKPGSETAEVASDELAEHEVLHVAHLVQDMIARHLTEHPAVSRNQKWAKAADELHQRAWDFYQLVARLPS